MQFLPCFESVSVVVWKSDPPTLSLTYFAGALNDDEAMLAKGGELENDVEISLR